MDGLETDWNYNTSNYGLCKNKVLHRHVRIAFLPN